MGDISAGVVRLEMPWKQAGILLARFMQIFVWLITVLACDQLIYYEKAILCIEISSSVAVEDEISMHKKYSFNSMYYDQRPKSRDLQRFLTDYCKHWKDIGLILGLQSSVIDIVASAHPMQDRECFREILEKWLQLNVEVTWANLELAITNANRGSLGLQPLTTTPRSQSEDTTVQVERRNETCEVKPVDIIRSCDVPKYIEVRKQLRDFVLAKLRRTYTQVVRRIINIFKEKKIDIEEVITILCFDDVEKTSIFSTDSVFNTIKTEAQLFHCVAQYCKSIYDYRVLDVLVQASGCPEAIKELTDFTELLQNSILTELDLMSEHGELLHPDDFMPETYKFVIEYVGGKCKLGTKEMVQTIVEQSVHLSKGTLIFKGFDVGSILFIYQISATVKNYLLQYKFTKRDLTFLEGNNIMSLIVDGVRIMSSSQLDKELQYNEGAVSLESMVSKQLDKLAAPLSLKDRELTLSTLRNIFDNIIQHPNDDKYHQIKLSDETFRNTVWQYADGRELMKISGWIVEDDHVRLSGDSCVQIVSQLLKSFLSSATGVVPFPDDEFQVVIEAFYNGDIPCIQKLLLLSHISPNGRIYSESGSSINLLSTATIAQHIDIVKLLMEDYCVQPYYMTRHDNIPSPYIGYIFSCAPQSFIIAILKYHDIEIEDYSVLHIAVFANCLEIVCFLLEEYGDIDVNVTDDERLTPLHLAYLCGHTQIAQVLIQHGADVYAVDVHNCTPYNYTDGDPDWIKDSEYMQNRRKIHQTPYSSEHCYYMKLVNLECDDEEAVSLTMEQFPSLKEGSSTRTHHDIDHASALQEFIQFITARH